MNVFNAADNIASGDRSLCFPEVPYCLALAQ